VFSRPSDDGIFAVHRCSVREREHWKHLLSADPLQLGAHPGRANAAPKTKQHILSVMRQILQCAVDWGYLQRNPTNPRLVKAPRSVDADVRPFASWEEVAKVAAAAGKSASLILFACATGLRPEEYLALTWADLDLQARTCRVNKGCVDGDLRTTRGKTDAAFRNVLLQQRAIDALAALARPIRAERLVFPAAKGGYLNLNNWRRRVWKKALEDAEIEHRPLYQMRHTYATLALAAGADVYWVSKQLGHANIQTTLKHYARFLPAVDERNLRLLDDFHSAAA
jgi:integrase